MTQVAAKPMTAEEYLEFEAASELRHEFVDGTLHAMAGSSLTHNEIVFNIRIALAQKVRERACVIATEALKVVTKHGRYRYPDLVIGCGENSSEYFIDHPCFIAEVQSDSTNDPDNGAKLEEYTSLVSLQRYAIVSQKTRGIVVYKRSGDTWTFAVLQGSGEFDLPRLETTLSLDQIYAGLELQGAA